MSVPILLIEDNLGDIKLFEEMIKEANFEIDTDIQLFSLYNLDDQISEFIIKNEIKIVFLDLGLPGTQGKDTVIKFRQYNSNIPLVAYTGTNDISLGAELLAIGSDDYICKSDATSSIILKTIWLNLQRFELQSSLQEKEQLLLAQSRNAAMGDMIAMIAHQWKQPLSVLSMLLNNMRAFL